MMNKNILFVLVLSIFLITSCKTTQRLRRGERATSAQKLVELIQQAEPKFATMNASNISMILKLNGSEKKVSASLRIITDSVVAISIYPFMGIEMFSLELYPDRWMLYDKINGRYFTDSYDYLFYRFGIDADFHTLQSLFSAQLFCVGESVVDAKKCVFESLDLDRNQITFESKHMKQVTQTSIAHTLDGVTLQSKKGDYNLTTTYTDYVESRGINYPRSITLSAFSENHSPIGLSMKISKVSFDSDFKLSLSNPERYKKSTIDQLMKE